MGEDDGDQQGHQGHTVVVVVSSCWRQGSTSTWGGHKKGYTGEEGSLVRNTVVERSKLSETIVTTTTQNHSVIVA